VLVLIAGVGAVLSVLAFPPFGPGWLVVPGMTLFLYALRRSSTPMTGLAAGAAYGLVFFAGLMWWLSELGLIAAVPLMVVQGAFYALYGWWLACHAARAAWWWYGLAVGGWALIELVRYRFPVGGLEWGAAGYALSDLAWGRAGAGWIGVSGLTVGVVVLAAALALIREQWRAILVPVGLVLVVGLAATLGGAEAPVAEPFRVAIVQGSTPCPFEHCTDERLGTFNQHLALTETLQPGEADLVVWSEGSTGSTNADPVLNEEIGEAIAAQARRLGAWFLVGSDRPVDEETWVNANVVFDPDGRIVGEYRKQHPVPFGEYIPFRPLFEWIPALDAVPRDMIPGDGPVVFDMGARQTGSVISFEGGFARYPRQNVVAGADLIVVATNEGSYGTTPASDQFIGMTRMRAAELGVTVVHAAVTGKSTVISADGVFDRTTGLGTQEIFFGDTDPGPGTLYSRTGDLLMWLAVAVLAVSWWKTRTLVGSEARKDEEE
jgi:apolipoprotein N-acyltransferase